VVKAAMVQFPGCGCNRGKKGRWSARLLQRKTTVVWSERLLLVMFSSLLAAIKVDGSERSLRAVMKIDGNEKSMLVVLVPQGITVGYDKGRWQREIVAGSVVQ
ncbi:hypothetical protein B296_00058497, partial [Ensete ventricosum]